ncbi:MAG TPA: sensor histidine kinase [Ktedonobacterales bacterium]|nr:sensor histidine kinase [Ktedonobacterales bacterium]
MREKSIAVMVGDTPVTAQTTAQATAPATAPFALFVAQLTGSPAWVWRRLWGALAWPLLYKVLLANSVVILLGATVGTYLATRLRGGNDPSGLLALVGFVVAGLLVSVAINYALLKVALAPLAQLRDTMRQAQAGDLAQKATITGQDPEADQLASAFNAMLAAIDELSRSRASHILHAQEQERKRIARELHDETGQALTTLLIGLALLDETATGELAHARVADMRALVHQTLRAVRNMSIDLRPSALDDLGLLPALRWYVKEYQQKCGVEVELTAHGLKERLPAEIETAIYRIVQESLTNTARHAHARHAWVVIREEHTTRENALAPASGSRIGAPPGASTVSPGVMSYNEGAPGAADAVAETTLNAANRLTVTIRDDGAGFDAAATLKKSWQDRGLGLAGMRERAMLLNGVFALASHPGAGTTITVSVPLEATTKTVDLARLAARPSAVSPAGRSTPPPILEQSDYA